MDEHTATEDRTVTRQQLYELVWARPTRTVAAEFGISDVGLAKICRRLDVPKPQPGYWARLAHGQKVKKASLPRASADTPVSAVIRGATAQVRPPKKEEPPAIVVPETLTDPHPAVAKIQKALGSRHRKETDTVRVQGKDRPVFWTSYGQMDRALRILDSFLKALEARGYEVVFKVANGEGTRSSSLQVISDATEIGICIFELTERHDHVASAKEKADAQRWLGLGPQPPKYDHLPCGRLKLLLDAPSYGGRRSWSDARGRSLQERLGAAVVSIAPALEAVRQDRADRAEEQRRWQEECRLREQQRQRDEQDKALAEDLEKMIASSQRAARIREFVAEVAAKVPAERQSAGLHAWVEWARRYADRVDPLSKPLEIAKIVEPPAAGSLSTGYR